MNPPTPRPQAINLSTPLIVCFSHLRWDFVFQRPQQLMTRLARQSRVHFWEEPIDDAQDAHWLEVRPCVDSGVTVLVPHIAAGLPSQDRASALKELLDEHLTGVSGPLVRWYYTPMMLPFSKHLAASCTVYDCMDELANFKSPPAGILDLESELLEVADLVFTGGQSLYEAKRDRHVNVHCFPSSVDVPHFAAARTSQSTDHAAPTFGYYGVIDERIDLALIAAVADARPNWQIEMVGPLAKIDKSSLPQRPNLTWVGQQDYSELPRWLARWDVALMPFALNDATRFISPTKTPEYLAGGRPVVSTPVMDVVRSYGDLRAVMIAESPASFVTACQAAYDLAKGDPSWLQESDAKLAGQSWDTTVAAMRRLIDERLRTKVAHSAKRPHYDFLIVGAGFAGAVMAERLAADSGKRVLVIDKRPHIAGNAYDRLDDAGILIHQYGPHIFHTNSSDIFDYLSSFTAWRAYEHRVLAKVGNKQVPMPINRTTLNALYDLNMQTEAEVQSFLAARAEPVSPIRTSEDVVISQVGRELYETFFQGYTRKQWGLDPSQLDKAVTARVPTRTNTDDRYFSDTYQAMPRDGYTAMFAAMLDHPNIDVELGIDFADAEKLYSYDRLIFTGPIDEFFGFRYGKLPYRSLRFEHSTVDSDRYQAVAVVNYPSPDVPYTRITEYKYLTGQKSSKTSITHEFPTDIGDPYYPVPRPENQALFKRYEALALATPEVIFVGRLATYRYYNMDQIVGQALATYRRLVPELAMPLVKGRQLEAAS